MFLIRYATNEAGDEFDVLQLSPAPTEVDYPEEQSSSTLPTPDGNPVHQRSVSDGRPRSWVWLNYPADMASFDTLWTTLQSFYVRERLSNALPRDIFIWENDSGYEGYGETTDGMDPDFVSYSNIDWVEARVTGVTREIRKGGGRTVYDTSAWTFYIVDDNWEQF